ncbi:VCBS repeat-containing protein [candidate division KSB1 bacterium]|nr:VCBS repeat-containing protein [candidate division KSB1 bacterium]
MVKLVLKFIALNTLYFCLASANFLSAQDLTAFEVIDNESVGLTVTPYEKYGMAVADIDRNGYPDIFCLRWKSPSYSRIFVNNQGIFQDITDQSPLESIEEVETGTRTCLWVDYDNDGDRDLSMSTDTGLFLLRNDNNIFTDVSDEVGFVGQKPPGFISSWVFSLGGWADYDLDGDLDCVVGQENNDNLYLFRNDDGVFTNVATEAGLDGTVLAESSKLTWIDIDQDGDPDLYSAYNVFRNDDGVFTNITEQIGLGALKESVWREFFDYDNDSDFDFFKAVSSPESGETNEIWQNQDGVFVNVTADVGLTLSADRYRGMTIGDCDNDGDQDIFLQLNIDASLDILLVNDVVAPGDHVFADVASFVGITKTGDRKGAIFFDYNRDGWLDIYLPSAEHNHILYKNLGGNGANWVGFILEGTVSNRDAVGSLVTLYTGEKKQIRYTVCGNGFVRQDNPWVHFGLGYDTSIDSVVIRWPLGYKQVLTDVAINQYHEIEEPTETSVETQQGKSAPLTFQLEQNYPNPFNPTTTIRYSLVAPEKVTLKILNIQGVEITSLIDGEVRSEGLHQLVWNGNDKSGQLVPSGIYIYHLQAGEFSDLKKMMFIK